MTTATLLFSAKSLLAEVPDRLPERLPSLTVKPQRGSPSVNDAMHPEHKGSKGSKWPFNAPKQKQYTVATALPEALAFAPTQSLTDRQATELAALRAVRRRMAWDVVLVLGWGAMIPAFMWLGTVAGF